MQLFVCFVSICPDSTGILEHGMHIPQLFTRPRQIIVRMLPKVMVWIASLTRFIPIPIRLYHIDQQLRIYARKGRIGRVAALLRSGARTESLSRGGQTALQIAVEAGHLTIIMLLRRHVTAQKAEHEEAFHWASETGDSILVERLIKHGTMHVDSKRDVRDHEGVTALYQAVKQGNRAVVDVLLRHNADVNIICRSSPSEYAHHVHKTPLFIAAEGGDVPMVKLLLQAGATYTSKSSTSHVYSVLEAACSAGHLPVVMALVESGADINTEHRYASSPMISAAEEGHSDVVMYLIDRWAVYQLPSGHHAVGTAMDMGHFELAEQMRTTILARIRRRIAARVIVASLKKNIVRIRRLYHLKCAMVLRATAEVSSPGYDDHVIGLIADHLEVLYHSDKSP